MILPIESFIFCGGNLINRTLKYTLEIEGRFSEESCAIWTFEFWRRIKISVS